MLSADTVIGEAIVTEAAVVKLPPFNARLPGVNVPPPEPENVKVVPFPKLRAEEVVSVLPLTISM